MEFKKDVWQFLLLHITGMPRKELELRLAAVRTPCMDYLKKNALQIFKDKIAEVYAINYFRTNVIDLPQFLQAVEVVDRGKWGFSIRVNEHELRFFTAAGEPIYQIDDPLANWGEPRGVYVRHLKEYWRTPIEGIREDKYYTQEAAGAIDDFIKTSFLRYVQKLVKGGK